VIKTAAKVAIAVATVELSLLAESVYGHISEDDHRCQAALADAIEATPPESRAQTTSEEECDAGRPTGAISARRPHE